MGNRVTPGEAPATTLAPKTLQGCRAGLISYYWSHRDFRGGGRLSPWKLWIFPGPMQGINHRAQLGIPEIQPKQEWEAEWAWTPGSHARPPVVSLEGLRQTAAPVVPPCSRGNLCRPTHGENPGTFLSISFFILQLGFQLLHPGAFLEEGRLKSLSDLSVRLGFSLSCCKPRPGMSLPRAPVS